MNSIPANLCTCVDCQRPAAPEACAGDQFYIVSLRPCDRRNEFVTFWRPKCWGYASLLKQAGKYSRADIRGRPAYLNNHRTTMAVPCAVVEGLAAETPEGMVTGGLSDLGRVVFMTPQNWTALQRASLQL